MEKIPFSGVCPKEKTGWTITQKYICNNLHYSILYNSKRNSKNNQSTLNILLFGVVNKLRYSHILDYYGIMKMYIDLHLYHKNIYTKLRRK